MMGTRQKLNTGTEYDAIYARHMYLYIWHHSHSVKKDLARRRTRAIKQRLAIASNWGYN